MAPATDKEPGGLSTDVPDRDATLDEFLDAGADGESDVSTAGEGSTTDDQEPKVGESNDEGGTATDGTETDSHATPADGASPVAPSGGGAVDPAEATYRWTGDGARCDGCGDHVERLWRDDAGLVCGECKEW